MNKLFARLYKSIPDIYVHYTTLCKHCILYEILFNIKLLLLLFLKIWNGMALLETFIINCLKKPLHITSFFLNNAILVKFISNKLKYIYSLNFIKLGCKFYRLANL